MEKDISISIIMPVYNGEKYIEKFLQEFNNYDFPFIQLIIINDGSSDNTAGIIDRYLAIDDRIVVRHLTNRGVSSARNTGLSLVNGTYTMFCDADDTIRLENITDIMKILESERPDILLANIVTIKADGSISKKRNYNCSIVNKCNTDDLLIYLFSNRLIGWEIVANIYKTECVKNILFDEDMTVSEDGDWLIRVLLNARTYSATNQIIYNYMIDNNTSVMHQKYSFKRFLSSYKNYVNWFEYFSEYSNAETAQIMQGYYARCFASSIAFLNHLRCDDYRLARKMVIPKMYILRYSSTKAHRSLFYIYKLFGLRVFIFINEMLMSILSLIKKNKFLCNIIFTNRRVQF